MNEYYIHPTLEAANAALAVINGFLPVVGLRRGAPAPERTQTTRWVSEPRLMLSGEYAILRIPTSRLDNAGELTQVNGVWTYAGVPAQKRIDFITEHGTDIRELGVDDFPAVEDAIQA